MYKRDISGHTFGRLTAVSPATKKTTSGRNIANGWMCRCECGNSMVTSISSLRRGLTRSCGCLALDVRRKIRHDLTGAVFSRLTVLSLHASGTEVFGRTEWLCKCECGNTTITGTASLRNGNTRSCGCLLRDHVRSQPKGSLSPNWKGGRRIEEGYVLIYMPEHPRAKSNGYVREHTVVMEKMIGRCLYPNEQVHHKNANKEDNRPKNLELWVKSQPSGARVKDLVEWANFIIGRYGNGDFACA